MSQLARVDKLWPYLSARERGILVLRSLKTGEREDYRLRQTMPSNQKGEFNHYIALMNGVNLDVSALLVALREILLRVETLAELVRLTRLWAVANRRTLLYLDSLPVPITKSDYEKERVKAGEKMLTFEDAAELLADHRYDEGEQDFSEMTEEEEDQAWEELMAQARVDLQEAVRAGIVAGGKDGTGIRLGSLLDWIGEPVPAYPEIGTEYDIRPDEEAENVERLSTEYRLAGDILRSGPCMEWYRLARIEQGETGNGLEEDDEALVARGTIEGVKRKLQRLWIEAAAINEVIAEVGEEFNGEDPARSLLRGLVEEVLEGCRRLAQDSEDCLGKIDLPEPGQEVKEAMWALVNAWGEANL